MNTTALESNFRSTAAICKRHFVSSATENTLCPLAFLAQTIFDQLQFAFDALLISDFVDTSFEARTSDRQRSGEDDAGGVRTPFVGRAVVNPHENSTKIYGRARVL